MSIFVTIYLICHSEVIFLKLVSLSSKYRNFHSHKKNLDVVFATNVDSKIIFILMGYFKINYYFSGLKTAPATLKHYSQTIKHINKQWRQYSPRATPHCLRMKLR